MKPKRLPVLLLFTFAFYLFPCTAQVPMGFNYQAIARDGSGGILANTALPVKITIQTFTGTVIYEELFSSVLTNQFGLISLVVGTGTWQSGSAATFSAIDWKIQTLYLKTTIQYPGTTWTTMGTSQLWGVPYSLVAKEVTGPLSKLGITGTTDVMDEALFEVKNKAGKTVFAVYNEGIRANVGNGLAKGVKGGFSVGGYDATKSDTIRNIFVLSTDSARFYLDSKPHNGTKGVKGGFSVGGYDMTKGGPAVQNYLAVSKDSVRIYIDSNPSTKGVRGGFSVGGYDMTKGGTPVSNYLNVETNASGIINPSQNRILWYPLKNAFLTGRVRIGTPDSVGINSFATGYESKSRGKYSQAMGFKAIANGDYSTAIGKNAVVNSINSFAFGDSARATNSESYAIGRGADASGYRSFAFGSAGVDNEGKVTGVTRATGDYSFAIGEGSIASGKGAFAIGIEDTARGNYSIALGYKTLANYNAISMGYGSKATQIYSTAMGYSTLASGAYSIAMGSGSIASGSNSTAMGYSTASASQATSMGSRTIASGASSTAMGAYTTASGYYTTSMGNYTTAPSACETVIGKYNTDYTPASAIFWNAADKLFVIGNGTASTAKSNAVTVMKNGNVGIGNFTPSHLIHLSGGAYSDGATWVNSSDINLKENFEEVDGKLILGLIDILPITKWNYKADNSEVKHIGPVAQDFYRIFGLGNDDKSISSVDPASISLVAVKELSYQNKLMIKQIESQQKEIDELKTLVSTLIANQAAKVEKQ